MKEFPLIVTRDMPKRAYREGQWLTIARAVPGSGNRTREAALALAQVLSFGRPQVKGSTVIFRKPVDHYAHMAKVLEVEQRFGVLFNKRFGPSFFGVKGRSSEASSRWKVSAAGNFEARFGNVKAVIIERAGYFHPIVKAQFAGGSDNLPLPRESTLEKAQTAVERWVRNFGREAEDQATYIVDGKRYDFKIKKADTGIGIQKFELTLSIDKGKEEHLGYYTSEYMARRHIVSMMTKRMNRGEGMKHSTREAIQWREIKPEGILTARYKGMNLDLVEEHDGWHLYTNANGFNEQIGVYQALSRAKQRAQDYADGTGKPFPSQRRYASLRRNEQLKAAIKAEVRRQLAVRRVSERTFEGRFPPLYWTGSGDAFMGTPEGVWSGEGFPHYGVQPPFTLRQKTRDIEAVYYSAKGARGEELGSYANVRLAKKACEDHWRKKWAELNRAGQAGESVREALSSAEQDLLEKIAAFTPPMGGQVSPPDRDTLRSLVSQGLVRITTGTKAGSKALITAKGTKQLRGRYGNPESVQEQHERATFRPEPGDGINKSKGHLFFHKGFEWYLSPKGNVYKAGQGKAMDVKTGYRLGGREVMPGHLFQRYLLDAHDVPERVWSKTISFG